MQGFSRGIGDLVDGFRAWRLHGAAMTRALIPAAIVALLVLVGLIVLVVNLDPLARAITPFADSWDVWWTVALRIGVAIAILAAAVGLVSVTFTALTLTVGEPFYDRVWRAVETEDGSELPDADTGFTRAVRDGTVLLLRGIGIAVLTLMIGFIPIVGAFGAAVLGTVLNGAALADELTTRSLEADGFDRRARGRLRAGRRSRVLGFGVAAHLCFLVPLGAIVAMPAAVAGATRLARALRTDAR